MRWLPIALLAACSSGGGVVSKPAPYVPQVTGRVDLQARGLTRLDGGALAVDIDPADRGRVPPRLVRELDRGRTRLVLDRPSVFSAAAEDLLRGDTTFALRRVEVRFAQQAGAGEVQPPALLILSGGVAPGALGVERMEAYAGASRGLDDVDNADLRVALGSGLDTAMLLGTADPALATYSWQDVRQGGAAAEPEAWQEALRAMRRTASLDPVRAFHVVVRRWQPGAEPNEAFFRVPLSSVVLCAQMEGENDGEEARWTWEGFWEGEWRPPDAPGESLAPGAETVLRYSVFREVRAEGGPAVLSTLLAPVTVGVKYSGRALERWFEGE